MGRSLRQALQRQGGEEEAGGAAAPGGGGGGVHAGGGAAVVAAGGHGVDGGVWASEVNDESHVFNCVWFGFVFLDEEDWGIVV